VYPVRRPRTRRRRRIRILVDPTDPDVAMVCADDSVLGAIPVIPTSAAQSYWMHPAHDGLVRDLPWSATPQG